jgi:hypothetical protein
MTMAQGMCACLHCVVCYRCCTIVRFAYQQLADKRLRPYYASLAYQVQSNLETVAMDYVTQLRLKTGGILNIMLEYCYNVHPSSCQTCCNMPLHTQL